jgi:hypothetical protein
MAFSLVTAMGHQQGAGYRNRNSCEQGLRDRGGVDTSAPEPVAVVGAEAGAARIGDGVAGLRGAQERRRQVAPR